MAYTKTNWLEHSMNTAAKIVALDNLETMYTQAVSYIDAITHATSYYTEAQANAKYFTSATDGAGSGLVCATLDGYTAIEIIAAGTPAGVIAIWSGTEGSIPSGWLLCNGSSGTPDLRDKFIVGAGSNYARAATGGANTVTTAATITIAGHALTADEIPLHSHGTITDNSCYQYSTSAGPYLEGAPHTAVYSNSNVNRNTGYTGSGSEHTHTASFAGTASQDKRPPYMARCFIMKS